MVWNHTLEYGYGHGTRTRTYKAESNPYPFPYPYHFFCPFCSVYVTSSPELKSTRTPSIFPYPQGKGTRTRSRTRTENVGISYVPVSVPIPVLFQYTFRTSKTRKISESKDTVTRAPPSPLFPIPSDNYNNTTEA